MLLLFQRPELGSLHHPSKACHAGLMRTLIWQTNSSFTLLSASAVQVFFYSAAAGALP